MRVHVSDWSVQCISRRCILKQGRWTSFSQVGLHRVSSPCRWDSRPGVCDFTDRICLVSTSQITGCQQLVWLKMVRRDNKNADWQTLNGRKQKTRGEKRVCFRSSFRSSVWLSLLVLTLSSLFFVVFKKCNAHTRQLLCSLISRHSRCAVIVSSLLRSAVEGLATSWAASRLTC